MDWSKFDLGMSNPLDQHGALVHKDEPRMTVQAVVDNLQKRTPEQYPRPIKSTCVLFSALSGLSKASRRDVQTFTLPIDRTLVEPSARVQASGSLVLTFREESDWDDLAVIHVLQSCFDHIEQKVISRLRPFFEATPK